MTKPKPRQQFTVPDMEPFYVLTAFGPVKIKAQRVVLDGGVLTFLVEGTPVVAYAPGRWLSFYRVKDCPTEA